MKPRKIFENFYVENDIPLDAKSIVSSLSNLVNEIPLMHRYYGLFFFNREDKKYYAFKNSLLTPELLIVDNNVSTIFGITVSDYSELLSELNLYSTLGKLIYVANLNVVFKFDGINWNYYSGIYNFTSPLELNNFPTELKCENITVNYLNELYLFDENFELIKQFVVTNNLTNLNLFLNDNNLLDNRYFIHKKQLFKNINYKKYKVGSEQIFIDNFTINNGITLLHTINVSEIGVNNNPPYINAIIWINNNVTINNFLTVLKPIDLSIFYKLNNITNNWEIYAESDNLFNGKLELQF